MTNDKYILLCIKRYFIFYFCYILKNSIYFDYDTAFIAPVSNHHYYSEHGHSKTINYDNPDDDWYENFLKSGKTYELNVDNDQANNNRTTIYINCRMENEKGDYIGACGVGLTMNDMAKEIRRFETYKGYNVMLVSKDGRIQVSSETDYNTTSLSKNSPYVYKDVTTEIRGLIQNYDYTKNYKIFLFSIRHYIQNRW